MTFCVTRAEDQDTPCQIIHLHVLQLVFVRLKHSFIYLNHFEKPAASAAQRYPYQHV